MKIPNYFNKLGTFSIIDISENYLVTPHNLTSYSNADFTVSQDSNADGTRLAWRAMDGSNKDSERDCAVTNKGYGNWWQIKFNNNVTIKKVIFTARKNTADETETVNSKDLVLQYSTDGSNFYDVVYFEVNLKSQAETTVYVKTNNYAQYWRIKDTDTILTHHLIIGELQFTYEKYPYDIKVNDQYIIFKPNEYNSIPINYEAGSKVSFKIVEGTLPEGIEFDAKKGIFYGTPTSIGENNLVVEVSNSHKKIQFYVIIKISQMTINITPHNLTSNTSDSRYILSQSSNVDSTRLAYYAMEGDEGYSHTSYGQNEWWQIEFTEGPVFVQQIKYENGGSNLTSFYTSEFKLLGSNNGTTFEEIQAFTLNSAAYTTTVIPVNTRMPYKFYRIQNNSGSGKYLILCEIEFTYIN